MGEGRVLCFRTARKDRRIQFSEKRFKEITGMFNPLVDDRCASICGRRTDRTKYYGKGI